MWVNLNRILHYKKSNLYIAIPWIISPNGMFIFYSKAI